MSDPKDKKPVPDAPAPKSEAEKSSGRVAFDPRGNPIWEWETSTGIYGRDVSTQRLKKLEAKDLAIDDTPFGPARGKVKKGELSIAEPSLNRATGFNPYDNSAAVSPRGNVADSPRKPVKDLRKLDQWIKLKKSLKDKK